MKKLRELFLEFECRKLHLNDEKIIDMIYNDGKGFDKCYFNVKNVVFNNEVEEVLEECIYKYSRKCKVKVREKNWIIKSG